MIRKTIIVGIAAAAALGAVSVGASAHDIVSFGGSTGLLSSNENFSDAESLTSVNAQGFYLNPSSVWTPADLYRRNQTNDMGLGVCNPIKSSHCSNGGGDYNELSNLHGQELIQLTLPTPSFEWVEVDLSSLDSGGSPKERGIVFAANSALRTNLSLESLLDGSAAGITEISRFVTNGGSSYGPIDLSGFANSPYLYFIAFDWAAYDACINGNMSTASGCATYYETHNNNNDYLIQDVVIAYPAPEPATLSIVGLGLAGLGFMRRRKARG